MQGLTVIQPGLTYRGNKPIVKAGEALDRFIAENPKTVLDVGSGFGSHASIMREAGIEVQEIDISRGLDYLKYGFSPQVDGIWCCHVLEHQRNPGLFLDKIKRDLKPGGLLAITVPPAKHNLVGGHVTLWNEGVLLYQLILAGFDCSEAKVGVYGYNISVLVRNKDIELPKLKHDKGDIESLKDFFPFDAMQGIDGRIGSLNWS